MENLLKHYINLLTKDYMPDFLYKYLNCPSLERLKKIGYFCGMDYASKDIYNFSEYISRYDHSLTTSLITYRLTKDKKATLAGLFHDISTPCFSHVVDYMNKDYEKQESTEEYTEHILKNDLCLLNHLKEDNIDLLDISNFKKYPIVDNERPKVCADRIDGVILTGIGWTKNISKEDISQIVSDMKIYINENGEQEIGFSDNDVVSKILKISESIDLYCHSQEDNYMMELLASITRYALSKGYIRYYDLYTFNEEELFNILRACDDIILNSLIYQFVTIKKEDIPVMEMPKIKIRELKPIVGGKR